MITVENDWVEYAPVPVRPVAVRGGAACGQRSRVVAERPRLVAAPAVERPVPSDRPTPSRLAPVTSGLTPPVAGAAERPTAARLRLTRRGRVVLVVLPAVLAATTALVSLTAPFAEAQPVQATRTVVVGTGDTLWSIAARVAPQTDPRDVVAALERANHLPDATVLAGQRLVLPSAVGR